MSAPGLARAFWSDGAGAGERREEGLPAAGPAEVGGVLHASGHPFGLASALRLAGFEARVTVLSGYGYGPVGAPLGAAFYARRVTL